MDNLETSVKKNVKGFKDRSQELCALLQVIRNKMEDAANFGPELESRLSITEHLKVQHVLSNIITQSFPCSWCTLTRNGNNICSTKIN